MSAPHPPALLPGAQVPGTYIRQPVGRGAVQPPQTFADVPDTASMESVLEPAAAAAHVMSADWYSVKAGDNSLDALAKTRQRAMQRRQQAARPQVSLPSATVPLWQIAGMAPFESSSNFNFMTTPVPQTSMRAAHVPTALPSAADEPLPLHRLRFAPKPHSATTALKDAQQQQAKAKPRGRAQAKPRSRAGRGKRGTQAVECVTAHHTPLLDAVSAQSAQHMASPPTPVKKLPSFAAARLAHPSSTSNTQLARSGAIAQSQQALQQQSKQKSAAKRAKSSMVGRAARRVQMPTPAHDHESEAATPPQAQLQASSRSVSARVSRRAKSAAKVPMHRAAMQEIVASDIRAEGSLQAAAQALAPEFAATQPRQAESRAGSANNLDRQMEAANQISFGDGGDFDVTAPDGLNHTVHSLHFSPHLEEYQLLQELKHGRVFCGLVSCSKNAQGRSGSVFIPSLACSIDIPSSSAMNRAMHGDLVAVRLDRGSGLGATRGGALATADPSQLSQEVLQSARAGDVMAISSALRAMASARVGTVVRILRREHSRPFVVRVAKFSSWQAIPLDSRFPSFSLRQTTKESSNKFRGKLFMAFPRPHLWDGRHFQCPAFIPGGLSSPLPLDLNDVNDAVLALQIEQGALRGLMADDATTQQHQQQTEVRVPWFREVHGVAKQLDIWRNFCSKASKYCLNWSMQWSDALSRGTSTHGPAHAYRAVAENDFLKPCLQPHMPALAARSFQHAPAADDAGRLAEATIIPCLSMDPHGSVALDDAISVVPISPGDGVSTLQDVSHRLFIHIADPIFVLSSAAATAGSKAKQVGVFKDLVLSALQRACSFHTSGWGVQAHQGMVPPAVLKCASLAAGRIRPALSIVLDVSTSAKMCALVTTGPSTVYNVAPLTYEQGQQLLDGKLLSTTASELPDSILLGPSNSSYGSILATGPALAATARSMQAVKEALRSRRLAPRGGAVRHGIYQDLTAASVAKLTGSGVTEAESSLDAHDLVSEFMQAANGVVGSVLACQAVDTGIFFAQPPPPVQSLHVLAAYTAYKRIPLQPAEFGFYSWPGEAPMSAAAAAGGNPDSDLLMTLKRIFGFLMQRSQYITGSMVFNKPDILPNLLSTPSEQHGELHGSTAQPVVDSSHAQEFLPDEKLRNIPVAFHNCGQGFTAYTHFSSPLRKGADMLVHTQLHVMFGCIDGEMLAAISATGEKLQHIVQHFNTVRVRQRSLQQSSEDIALRLHLQKRLAWAPVQLNENGQLSIPAFRGSPVELPKHLQNQNLHTSSRLGDTLLRPDVTNVSLFYSRTQPKRSKSSVSIETDSEDDAAWALFHVFPDSQILDSSRFEMSALAFPLQDAGSFPSPAQASFDSGGSALAAGTIPTSRHMSFLQLHFPHLSEKSSLSVLPAPGPNCKTTVCLSMTHYLAEFLPSLWAELLDSSIKDQPKGKVHMAVNVLAMFDRLDGEGSWAAYRGARRAHKASASGSKSLRPQAALWIANVKEVISNSSSLPERHPKGSDLPLKTPAASSLLVQPRLHLVQHPPDSRAVSIPYSSGEALLPEYSPQVKCVSATILPSTPVQMAGRTATLLLPASTVAEPHVKSHVRERLMVKPGHIAIVTIPDITWRAYAFVREVSKRTRIIPEAPQVQPSIEVFSHSSSGLHSSGFMENSVVAVSVMFMHGTPSLPECLVDLAGHVGLAETELPVYAGVFGLQLQLIPTPPSQQRNLRILADMHELAKKELDAATPEQLIAQGISYGPQSDADPSTVSSMAASLAMSQVCFAAGGIKTLTRSGSDLLRDIVCGWNSGESAVASFANPACDWLLTELLPDKVFTQELFVSNTLEALQAANSSVEYDSTLLSSAGTVAIVSDAELSLLAPELNMQQKRALARALSSQVTLLHGPPGTGKTSTASRMIFFFAVSNLHCAVAAATMAAAQAEVLAGMEDVLVDYNAPIFANLSDSHSIGMLPRQVHFCAPSHRAVNVLARQLWLKLPAWSAALGLSSPELVTDTGVADIRQALRQPRFTSPPFICPPTVAGDNGTDHTAASGAAAENSGGWGAPSDSQWGAPSQSAGFSSAPSVGVLPKLHQQSAFTAAEARFQAHLRHVAEAEPSLASAASSNAEESNSDDWRKFRHFNDPLGEVLTLTMVRVFPQHSSLRDIQRLWRESVADSLTDGDALLMEQIADHGALPANLSQLELAACTVEGQLDSMARKPGQVGNSAETSASDSQDVPGQYPRASCLHHLARDPAVCPHAIELLCIELVLRLEDARTYFNCPIKIYSAGSAYNQVPAVIAAGCGDQDALAQLKDNFFTTQTFAPPNATSLQPQHLLLRHGVMSNAAENYVLGFAHILLTTASEAGSVRFDQATAPRQVIVDEAAFCGELECLVPVPRAAKVVFIGDHKQLAPVLSVRSAALKKKLTVSLFERLVERAVMLRTQYRMHPAIAEFPSRYFYNSELQSGAGLQQKRKLAHAALPHMFSDASRFPVRFVQVQGIERNLRRKTTRTDDSAISQHVQTLLDTLATTSSDTAAGAAAAGAYCRGGLGHKLPIEYYTSSTQPSTHDHVKRASMGQGKGSLLGFMNSVRRAKPAGARSLALAALRLDKPTDRHSCPLAAALAANPTSIANVEEAVTTLLTLASVLARGQLLPHQVAIVSPYLAQIALLQNLFNNTCFPVVKGSPLASWAAKHNACAEAADDMAVAEPFSEHAQGGLPGACEVVLVAGDRLAEAGLSIATVHMGQGSERDVIILSTVRSADASRMPSDADGGLSGSQARRTLGFVAEEQMMNVAITRAREALIIVGDQHTLGLHSMWQQWLAEASANNSVTPNLTIRDSQAPWGSQ